MSFLRRLLGKSDAETGSARRSSHVTPSRAQSPVEPPPPPAPQPPDAEDEQRLEAELETQAELERSGEAQSDTAVEATAAIESEPEAEARPEPAQVESPPEPKPAAARKRALPPSPKPVLTRQRQALSYGIASDVGLLRGNNEDACFGMQWHSITVDNRPDFGFFVVADGMGGHLDGERAAGIAVQVMAAEMLDRIYVPLLRNFSAGDSPTVLESLMSAADKANRAVIKQVPGGGTTLSAIAIIGNLAYLTHVGDSRAYLIHEDSIEQLTTDHTLVQRLIEMNELTKAEAEHYPQKNVLYRAIGQNENLKMERLARALPPLSQVVICTDGLWDMVDDETIKQVAQAAGSPQETCDRLVSLANDRGGIDNITVIALRVPGGGAD